MATLQEGLAPRRVTCFSPLRGGPALLGGQEKARGREEVVSDFLWGGLWGGPRGGSHTPWVPEEEEPCTGTQDGSANRQEVLLEQNPSKQNSFAG